AQLRRKGTDLAGAARGDQQVLFEDLDAVEARVGAGVHLFFQRSAEADGGDGGTQGDDLSCSWGSRYRPWARSSRKCERIRAGSGSSPVMKRKASTAWPTAMWPPSSTRQPLAVAAAISSVSTGR